MSAQEMKEILDLVYNENLYMKMFIAERNLMPEFEEWCNEKLASMPHMRGE